MWFGMIGIVFVINGIGLFFYGDFRANGYRLIQFVHLLVCYRYASARPIDPSMELSDKPKMIS